MPINTANMPPKQADNISTSDKARYVAESAGLTGLFCGATSAAFAKFQKIDQDEFVKIGTKIDVVKDKVTNKEEIENGLKKLFTSEQKDDLIKMIKKEKLKSNTLFGLVIGLVGGALMGMAELSSMSKSKEEQK